MVDQSNKWQTIRVDSEVFALLQRKAKPLVDTANDVLRWLLLDETLVSATNSTPERQAPAGSPLVDSAAFVERLRHERFEGAFKPVGRYQYLFESEKEVVYFQNYNQDTELLWYRITSRPWNYLLTSNKKAWLCFTNPTGMYAYILHVARVHEHVNQAGWSRGDLKVHINVMQSLWTELDWCIAEYRYDVKKA